MQIDVTEREIKLSAEETQAYGMKTTDERGAYARQVTSELHQLHPGLGRDIRFTVVSVADVILFFVFTY
jgi:hypothetical protein